MLKIIFTDLDGTLLDHRTYSYQAAVPALNRIVSLSVPLILSSSKTAAELEEIRKALKLKDPFVSENGGGIHFPEEGEVVTLGLSCQELRTHMEAIAGLLDLEFQSIDDMSPGELADATGLTETEAELAQKRSFDLAFVVRGDIDLRSLQSEVEDRGLKLTRGARFFHLTGPSDKGLAVRKLVDYYQAKDQESIQTIGLGDSENDIPMLEEVDIPVIIPNPGSKAPLHLSLPRLITASSPGPAGWNEVVLSLLSSD